MRLRDPAGDRQSEAGAAERVARLVQADEALEDAFSIRNRNSAPCVAHDNLGLFSRPSQLQPNASSGRGVLDGVLDQVEGQLLHQRFVGAEGQGRLEGRVERDTVRDGEHPRRFHAFGEDLVGPAVCDAQWLPPGIGAGEHEHVVNHTTEALGLRPHDLERVAVLLFVSTRLGQRDFSGGSRRRHRRSQFVRGVGHELPLGVDGGGDAAEQPVEGASQLAHLVAGIRDGEPGGQRLDGRALGFVAHLRQGAQCLRCHPPADDRRKEQRHWHAQQQRPRQHGLLARNRRFGGGDENHERTVGGILALQPHAPCLRALLDRACQERLSREAGQAGTVEPAPVAGDGATGSIEDDHRAIRDVERLARVCRGVGQLMGCGELAAQDAARGHGDAAELRVELHPAIAALQPQHPGTERKQHGRQHADVPEGQPHPDRHAHTGGPAASTAN